jgi:hypothetical protein
MEAPKPSERATPDSRLLGIRSSVVPGNDAPRSCRGSRRAQPCAVCLSAHPPSGSRGPDGYPSVLEADLPRGLVRGSRATEDLAVGERDPARMPRAPNAPVDDVAFIERTAGMPAGRRQGVHGSAVENHHNRHTASRHPDRPMGTRPSQKAVAHPQHFIRKSHTTPNS